MFASNLSEDIEVKEIQEKWLERKHKQFEDIGKVPQILIEERTWWKLLKSLGVNEFRKYTDLPEEKIKEEVKVEEEPLLVSKSSVPDIFWKKIDTPKMIMDESKTESK